MISCNGRSRQTANFLKMLRFGRPEWTPCRVSLLPAAWIKHREAMEQVVLAHPRIFPGFRKGSHDFDAVPWPLYEPGRHTDSWGAVWENIERGMDSAVVVHPLADWSAMDGWRPPDPLRDDLFGPRPDWAEVKRGMDAARARGDLAAGGGLPHGFFYMRLYYQRGFENLMIDLATDDPHLARLVRIVEDHDAAVVRKYVGLGAELISLGDDLGMQKALPMSPAMWRRHIKPSYMHIMEPCRKADVPVYLHSDGHILEIIADLVEAGVRMLNPQIRANGLDGLKRFARGKVAIDLDLDRQLFPFATPRQIEDHIAAAFEALYMKEGGLALVAECGPDVPPEKVDAICRTLERLCNPPAQDAL